MKADVIHSPPMEKKKAIFPMSVFSGSRVRTSGVSMLLCICELFMEKIHI